MNDDVMLETRSNNKLDETLTNGTTRFDNSRRDPQHLPPLVNKPGELVWISVHDLHVDRKYQAAIRKRTVNRIANAWNWVACGCLSVSLRKDGSGHFIFDGQHRWQAALLRGDISELPCIVYELDSAAEEAMGFVATNVERRILKRIEQHNAMLLIGDPIAKKIDQLMRESGRTVSLHASPTTFSAITVLSRCLQDDEKAMTRVWPILVELSRDRVISGRLVQALWAAERRMYAHQSLADDRWRDRLHKIGADAVLQAVKQAYVFEGRLSQLILAEATARAINRGLRQGHTLKLKNENYVRPTESERIKAGV